jgi:hypothetical protein
MLRCALLLVAKGPLRNSFAVLMLIRKCHDTALGFAESNATDLAETAPSHPKCASPENEGTQIQL